MSATCSYVRLAAGLAALSGVAPDEPVEQCGNPVQFYVSVFQDVADEYVVEHLTNVCADHEPAVGLQDGHQWSRLIRDPQNRHP